MVLASVAMDLHEAALLVIAGLGAGIVNAVAGGGSLITFPALIAAGLAPVPANVTNSIAVSPGYVASVLGSRADLPRGRVRALVPTAAVGSIAGCALLLATPARAFELVVPFLVLGATAVLAFQDRLRRLVGHPRDLSPRRQALALQAMVALGSLYGGYFGAALGVMFVAVLALVLDEPLVRVTAVKNVLSAVTGVTTVVVFALFGPVDWVAVAVLAPAAMLGGYAGARLARRLPSAVLKGVIVAFGTAVGVVLLIRAFS
ncbi:sulfite exporter TauE/SafE family protein [Phytohabitans rumicis]